MGTNYYHDKPLVNATRCIGCGGVLCCEKCDEESRVHIGKSSAGWTFSFHATETIRTYADWLEALIAGGRIVDEYGKEHSLAEFVAMVQRKRGADHSHAKCYPNGGRDYLDPLGNSFSTGDFS